VSKTSLNELAVYGKDPVFAEPLHVGRPNLGDRAALAARIDDILDRRWLTNSGPYVEAFERRVAELAGVRHCVATCNGTIGLELAARALALEGEVIVPAFTFIATAHALQWHGITPVFADIDPRTHLLDPTSVARAISPRTTAIVGVHTWGQVCDVTALETVARAHGLKVMFDAAHAFGCVRDGRPVGSFGDLEVFSFHATKFVHTLEGGAVTTNDDATAARLRQLRNFGFLGYDQVGSIGTNAKLNEFSAAMGLTSLDAMEEFIAINRRNLASYETGLRDVPGLRVMKSEAQDRQNFQYVVVLVDPAGPIARDALLRVLWAENIRARRYFYPGCHRMEPYRSSGVTPDVPVTEQVAAAVLVLPTGQSVEVEQIEAICGVIRLAASHGRELEAYFSAGDHPLHHDAVVT